MPKLTVQGTIESLAQEELELRQVKGKLPYEVYRGGAFMFSAKTLSNVLDECAKLKTAGDLMTEQSVRKAEEINQVLDYEEQQKAEGIAAESCSLAEELRSYYAITGYKGDEYWMRWWGMYSWTKRQLVGATSAKQHQVMPNFRIAINQTENWGIYLGAKFVLGNYSEKSEAYSALEKIKHMWLSMTEPRHIEYFGGTVSMLFAWIALDSLMQLGAIKKVSQLSYCQA